MALGGSEVIIGLGVASLLATAAGTAVSYMGAQQQAAAAQKKGAYDAQVAENNATAVTQQAAADAKLQRDRNVRIMGAQTASLAKSGSDLSTSGDVLYDTAVQGELDAMNIEYKGQLAANRYRQGGQLSQYEAANSASAAEMAGMGSLISGTAKVANQAYDMYPRGDGRPDSVDAQQVYPQF